MRNGFTLAELLAVVAILTVLAGLLFPVLSRARSAATKAPCSSNLHQLALAYQMYAEDTDGNGPPLLSPLKQADILLCPHDPHREAGGEWCQMTEQIGIKPCADRTSYGYLFGPLGPLEGQTPSATYQEEEFPALIVCLLHGDDAGSTAQVAVRSGQVLRVKRDGSLQSKKVPAAKSPDSLGINLTALFTP